MADKFKNFEVVRTVKIRLTTQDKRSRQEAERFVDTDLILNGRFEGKYKDFLFCGIDMERKTMRHGRK